MKKAGFDIVDGDSAIVPVMLYDAKLSQTMADELLKKSLCYWFFLCQRIKHELECNCNVCHTKEHLDTIAAFIELANL
jgi:glycine C-acetyltransferase